MPPTSVNIFEEGANVHSFKIVNNGVFDKKGLLQHMVDRPASYPGNSGCRNFRDVESDLKAVECMLSTKPIPSSKMEILFILPIIANCCQPQGYTADPRM
jgi:hypothetical protein